MSDLIKQMSPWLQSRTYSLWRSRLMLCSRINATFRQYTSAMGKRLTYMLEWVNTATKSNVLCVMSLLTLELSTSSVPLFVFIVINCRRIPAVALQCLQQHWYRFHIDLYRTFILDTALWARLYKTALSFFIHSNVMSDSHIYDFNPKSPDVTNKATFVQ